MFETALPNDDDTQRFAFSEIKAKHPAYWELNLWETFLDTIVRNTYGQNWQSAERTVDQWDQSVWF